MSNKIIAKSAGIISIATLCSRILGFIRDIIIARLFGVYTYAQAFVIAFRIPNLLRDLVGEGAVNSALVPVFSEYSLKKDKLEFWELANVVLNLSLVVLSTLTILGIIFAPFIVKAIAPGFISDPEKLATTIKLTRIIFPYILLVSLAAYSMGILNALRHFSVPAFAPCLLNISLIICVLVFGEGIAGLASGVLLGGLLQLAVQIPVLYRKGFRPKLFKKLAPLEIGLEQRGLAKFLTGFKHPAAKTIGRLMVPRLLSSSIYQLNNFVDSIFGSFNWIIGEGGVAVLYFSYRLIQFPLGIFSNALSQAILPALSIQALEETHAKLKHTLSWGLRTNFLVMLPAGAGLMALSFPIIATLFGGRKFDAYSVQATSSALFFYSIGLFAYGGTKIIQSGFFALKDTRTPAKIAGLALAFNVIFNFLLMYPLKIAGLALATSISGIATFLILLSILKKRLGDFGSEPIFGPFLRIFLASLAMGLVTFFVSQKIFLGATTLDKLFNLSFSIMLGIISYVIFCFVFKVEEIKELWKWARERYV
ncbi:MAG: murein biosynthesis integral membrane protein MurJ [Candidatus Omnitrophica bacterium CG11_big_fil_rev_8_21_14_0_20_42_13]|uniref:Probable lipid II flippase MurJ n=1 Tax=Candidatus Ghiorseimicrobium undicola TaxID=1974746 RepID=A0A2H0LZU2_9BACT|nr:MAG: murein biosynthesis integral membrane protein MurJ [Candidatus Omnitrophica bacterium CG11_big_fil_rev_8_21_14_0_20_42_13]